MENNEHPVQGVMESAMKNIKEMVDVNTIIGEPINTPDGTVIIPVSKVNLGFASGGSDFTTKNTADKTCFAGGSGAGITISPIAFLVVKASGEVSMLPIDQPSFSTIDKLVSSAPDLIETVKGFFKKDE